MGRGVSSVGVEVEDPPQRHLPRLGGQVVGEGGGVGAHEVVHRVPVPRGAVYERDAGQGS